MADIHENSVDIAGVIVLVVFYVIVLVVGIVAGRCFKANGASQTELSMVAGRRLGLGVGILTMSASFVGGGYLNGLAEGMASGGIAWTIPPLGIMLGLFLSAFVFGGPMRQRKCLTFFDPFQEKYGKEVTAFLFLAHLLGTNFYMAAILSALGSSLTVIIGLDMIVSIILSAAIAVLYTMLGMMVAVAYTDIIELVLIIIGMGIAIPFAATNEHVDLNKAQDKWLGTIEIPQIGKWIDIFILTFLGSIPWQGQFQRFLSARSVRDARIIGVVGGIVTFVLALAPLSIGAIGVSTSWINTTHGQPLYRNESSLLLPLVMYHLTPRPVAIIALCSVAAAVMSSLDSSLLGSSALFCHNVYRAIIRKKASEREFMWVKRVTIVILGTLASVTAIYSNSIYGLVLFGSDIGLVMVFPHLICSMYIPVSNGYGALIGSSLSIILRVGGGDELMNLAPFIPYPPYNNEQQLFPVRIFSVVIAIVTTVVISVIAKWLFKSGIISRKLDVLNQFADINTYEMNENEFNYKKEMQNVDLASTNYRLHNDGHDNPVPISDDL